MVVHQEPDGEHHEHKQQVHNGQPAITRTRFPWRRPKPADAVGTGRRRGCLFPRLPNIEARVMTRSKASRLSRGAARQSLSTDAAIASVLMTVT